MVYLGKLGGRREQQNLCEKFGHSSIESDWDLYVYKNPVTTFGIVSFFKLIALLVYLCSRSLVP